jgi:xyloglucan-specific exo-beta-1,4-glucanase
VTITAAQIQPIIAAGQAALNALNALVLVANTSPPAAKTWRPLKVGGGGFTRGISIAQDGTKVCKIDVFGAYLLNESIPSPGNAGGMGAWQQLCAPGRIPAGDPAFNPAVSLAPFFASMGAWDVQVSPSNSSVIFMLWLGMMYKSTNKGVTFVNQTTNAGGSFPQQTAPAGSANSPANNCGPQMAIDPINPSICWVGNFAGVFFTSNGGTAWSTLSTSILPLPVGAAGTYAFAFDAKSAVINGITQGIYAAVSGVGVFYSSNAGASFAPLAGAPTSIIRLVCDRYGVAWLTANTSVPNVWTYTVQAGTVFPANTWTNVAVPAGNGGTVSGIAFDPSSTSSAAQRVLAVDYGGSLAQSTNGGITWGDAQLDSFNEVATDIPWLATNEAFLTNAGGFVADPSQPNTFCLAEGTGVWTVQPPVTGAKGVWPAWTWNSQTAGIESLESTLIVSPPGGNIGLVQWDRAWFSTSPAGQYPSTYGLWPGSRANNNLNQTVIWPGNGADWAGLVPSFIAVYAGSNAQTAGQATGSAFSTNGGVPVTGFELFANGPPRLAPLSGSASMAVGADATTMMVVCNGLWATTNRGATAWVNVTPPGSSNAGWTNGFAQIAQQLASDKVTPGYYVAMANSTVYYTANAGSSWTSVTPGFSFGNGAGGTQIKAIPGNAGHYFLTIGGSYTATVDPNNVFYRTTDGGKTWQDVSNATYSVRDVYVWGFGAPNGGNYPAIFVYGYVNGVLGVWQSVDNCATWQQIGDAQFGATTFDNVNCMAGDMNTAGVVYVGFLGSGYLQYS